MKVYMMFDTRKSFDITNKDLEALLKGKQFENLREYTDERMKEHFIFADVNSISDKRAETNIVLLYHQLIINYQQFLKEETMFIEQTESYRKIKLLEDTLDFIPIVYLPTPISKLPITSKITGVNRDVVLQDMITSFLTKNDISYTLINPLVFTQNKNIIQTFTRSFKDVYITKKHFRQVLDLLGLNGLQVGTPEARCAILSRLLEEEVRDTNA